MATEQRCEQCGRVGTHGFRTIGAPARGVEPITVCASHNACRRRWPKRPAPQD